jgi:hypothetical protein
MLFLQNGYFILFGDPHDKTISKVRRNRHGYNINSR